MKKTSTFVCAAALVAVAGCNNPPATTDSGTGTTDTGTGGTDTGTGGSDTGTGGRDTGMSSSGGTCAMPIDIDTDGTALTTGTGRRITSSNASAPAGAMSGLLNGSCADDGMGGTTAGHEVVFHYTMQTTAYLVASTADSATTMGMDTIVWALDACSGSANELACNDDAGGELTSRALSDAMVPAGTEVFLVVAGYAGADVETGAFALVVSEIQPHAAGEACDADNYFCVDGYTCLRDAPGADTGHCLADGAENGLCRLTMPYCDGGLGCTVDMPTADDTGVCQVPIATGDACSDTHYLCMTGASCQLDEGSDTMGHCLADGTEYGNCRTTGTACDGALVCSVAMPAAGATGTCQMPVAGGDLCTARHSVCVDGFSCQYDDMSTTTQHCVADGGDLGECRTAMPYCDGALVCTNDMPVADDPGICLGQIAAGEVCTAWRYLCVSGSHCIADEGSDTMGHCLVDGSMGAACRDTDPACDGTLTCDPFAGLCTAG